MLHIKYWQITLSAQVQLLKVKLPLYLFTDSLRFTDLFVGTLGCNVL